MKSQSLPLGFLLLCLIALVVFTVGEAEAQRLTSSISTNDGEIRYKWQNNDELLEVRLTGDVLFSEDDAAVQFIAPGSLLRIEERRNGRTRTLEVRSGADGAPEYTYRVDGRTQTYEGAARDEIGDLILMVIRNTGINAEERVVRILDQGGVEAVFNEISFIESSSGKRRYFDALVVQGNLDAQQLGRVVREVTREIESSGTRSRFFRNTAGYYLAEPGALAAYFDGINTVSSSGDHARVLKHILKEHRPSREALVLLLGSTRRITSSGDKARVLIDAAPHYVNDSEVRAAYFEAVNTIPSAGDHTRVLKALLTEADLQAEAVTMLFESARRIQSDGDRARLLIAAAPHYVNNDAHRSAYFKAVNAISSSGDRARVLLKLIKNQQLNKPSLLALLATTKSIPSSGDMTRVLVAAADHVTSDDDLVEAYLDAADRISSPGDHSRALSALVR